MGEPAGLRERKKQRTRTALIDTAYRLFERKGYERTTTAEIAAAAEVSQATFFKHFPTKEDLLFPDDGQRILRSGLDAIEARREDETAPQTLRRAMLRMLTEASTGPRDPAGDVERVRLRLLTEVPALRATMLRRAFDAQRQLAESLHRAYAEELDELDAAATVGAVTGAAFAAAQTAVRTGRPLDRALRRAIDTATGRLGE